MSSGVAQTLAHFVQCELVQRARLSAAEGGRRGDAREMARVGFAGGGACGSIAHEWPGREGAIFVARTVAGQLEPGVSEGFCSGGTFGRTDRKHFCDQSTCFRGHHTPASVWEGKATIGDAVKDFIGCFATKRQSTGQSDVQQDATAEDVDRFSVRGSRDDLRAAVCGGSENAGQTVFVGTDAIQTTSEAKVCQLDSATFGDKNILSLDIAMDDVIVMKVRNGFEQLLCNSQGIFFIYTVFATGEKLEKITLSDMFHDDIKVS